MNKYIGYIKHNPGMVILFVFAVLLGWNTITVIIKNYQLQQRVDRVNEEISVLELENEQLEFNIDYYETDAYLEQRARESLNLRAPGEEVVIVPKRQSSDQVNESNKNDEPVNVWQKARSNLNDWIDLFSGRARPVSES